MTAPSDRVTDTLVVDSLQEPLFVVDPDGALVYANERLAEITTRPLGTLENGRITELTAFVEAGFDDLREGIEAVLRGDTTDRRVEVTIVHPDEAPVDGRSATEARLTRLTDQEGLVGVLVVMRDITDRKETEQYLRASERRFRGMFESHSAPMLLIEPESGSIEEANAAAADFYGYSVEELRDMTIQQINCLSPAEVAAERSRARAQNRNHFEFEHRLASDEVRTVEVHSSPVEVDGRELLFSVIHDITERKRREREYEQIFDGVNDIIAIHDPETGEMVDVNRRMCELTGHDRETALELGVDGLLGEHPSQDYAPDEASTVIDQVMDGDDVDPYEQVLETRDGKLVWIEVNPTRATIGGEERFVTISRDVTERKRREREYEQIFNSVQDAIAIVDPETHEMVDVNDAFCDLVGYDRETVFELGMAGVSAAEEGYTRDRAEEIIDEVVETGQAGSYEWTLETESGDHRVAEVVGTTAEIGGELRYISINRDITERRRREREFEQIFNGVQDAISVHDPDTVEILDANEAYLDMFGYEDIGAIRERGVSGLSVTEEGYTERRGREIHQRVVESDQPETLEWQSETRSGERIWLTVKIAPAVIGGEQRTISVQRDVTDRKRREQRLEVFNRILRHNLRNQLDVIRSYAEELGDQAPDRHAERIIDAVDELAATGHRAREIDRLMSRDATPTEVDIVGALRETVERVRSTRSSVTVTTEFPQQARLRTNEESVSMAVESALENALEYASSAVTVAVERGPDGCVITITDDGPGIPEAELSAIEAETETSLRHGRGLGLWQLRWCVDELNGQLSFETGEGTTVRIAVPDRRGSTRSD